MTPAPILLENVSGALLCGPPLLSVGIPTRRLKPPYPAGSWAHMGIADDYLNRGKAADEHAARCVSGSAQQSQFREIARQWRILARQVSNLDADRMELGGGDSEAD